jgi:predicted dehydrogenase
MTKDGKYGVGVFGIGYVAGEHIKAWANNPDVKIVALASRRKESAEAKKAELNLDCDILDSYDDLLKRDDIDIIDMTSPNFLRAEEIVKACEAQKHIMAEKPIVVNFEELKTVKKAYEEAKKKYDIKTMCCLVLNYYDQFLCTKSLIDKGALGDIYFAETDYWHNVGPWWHGWTWEVYKKKYGGSASLACGCHSVGVIMTIMGDVDTVYALESFANKDKNEPEGSYEYAPTYTSTLKFKSGMIGKTGSSFVISTPYNFNLVVHGTKGTIQNDHFFTKELFAGQEGWQDFNCILLNSGEVSHHPFQRLIDAFMDDVINDVESGINMDFAIKVHEVCCAIDMSAAAGGETIKLPIL